MEQVRARGAGSERGETAVPEKRTSGRGGKGGNGKKKKARVVRQLSRSLKIGFFDKINYSMIVSAFKQVRDRRHREVFFTNVPRVGTFH